MSDLAIKRMMTFITACCVLVSAVICFGCVAGICEEIDSSSTSDASSVTWRDHHYEIHNRDMEKMDRAISILREINSKVNK